MPLDPEPRRLPRPIERDHRADPVDVPEHEVAAQETVEPHGPLEVDRVAGAEIGEGCARQGLRAKIEGEVSGADGHRGQADAVDGHARADLDAAERRIGFNGETRSVPLEHPSALLDDPGEHPA